MFGLMGSERKEKNWKGKERRKGKEKEIRLSLLFGVEVNKKKIKKKKSEKKNKIKEIKYHSKLSLISYHDSMWQQHHFYSTW